MQFNRITQRGHAALWIAFGLVLSLGVVAPSPLRAQTIVLSVNGDPITTIDIDQRMKLLRVLKKPATRDAAVESLIIEHLKTREVSKYTVHLNDSDIGQEMSRVATDMKIAPNAMLQELQHAGVDATHYKAYFGGNMGYNLLIEALNKGVEASESEIRAELAKVAGKSIQYTLRQVIFSLPTPATVPQMQGRAKEAEQLRTRFTSCDSGIPIAREMSDVAVLDPIYRSSDQLAEQFRVILDKTPIGHLTQPERGPTGLEMVAVCYKEPSKDDSTVRAQISARLMRSRLEADADNRIKEMRSHAVILKMNGGAMTER